MIFLLDTNVISALMKSRPDVIARFRYVPAYDCGISSITAHELYFGALRHPTPDVYLKRIDLLPFQIIDFTKADAKRAGEIRSQLARIGTPIGPLDALIAAQALDRDLIVITHNTREFERVAGLKLEDWEA